MTKKTAPANIRPFRIEVAQADLDDLQARLARTRLPQPAPGDDWDYGTPNAWLSEALEAWKSFDWRAVEARLNAYPQYLTEIDGQTIHFIHVPSKEANATPLLLVHSYPGTVIDFLEMIDPLVDPVAHGGKAEDAFSVVIPSLPGFGYSTPVVDRGWTMARVARTFDTLMRRLGYEKLRCPRQRCRRDRRPRARHPEPRRVPRIARAAGVLVPLGRPRRVREARTQGLRGPRAHAVVPVGRWLQRDQRVPPPDRRGGAVGLADRSASPGTSCS